MLEMSLGSNNLWSTPELSKLQLMGKIWSTAHSVNKVLLEHSHSYLFTHLEPQQNFGEICLFILLHFNFPTNTYQAPYKVWSTVIGTRDKMMSKTQLLHLHELRIW